MSPPGFFCTARYNRRQEIASNVREFAGIEPRSSQLSSRVRDVRRRDWRCSPAGVCAGTGTAKAEAEEEDEKKKEEPKDPFDTGKKEDKDKKLVDAEGREYRVCPQCAYNMYKQGRMWVCENCGYSYVE